MTPFQTMLDQQQPARTCLLASDIFWETYHQIKLRSGLEHIEVVTIEVRAKINDFVLFTVRELTEKLFFTEDFK